MPIQPSCKGQMPEASQSLAAAPGNAEKDGQILDRPEVTGVPSTPCLVVQQGVVQAPRSHAIKQGPLPDALVPPAWSGQLSSAAAPRQAAHTHRRTWWPRQDSSLFKELPCRDNTGIEPQPVSATGDHAADSCMPRGEVSGTASRVQPVHGSGDSKILSMQQVGDSRRPAAASAAWSIQQQGASCLDSGTAQCCQELQSLVGIEQEACQELGEDAWPQLPGQQPTQQQQQHQQQQQQAQAGPEVAASQRRVDQLRQQAPGESPVIEPPQHDMLCSPGVATQQPQRHLSASMMLPDSGQTVVSPPLSSDAGLHLAPEPASVAACTCADDVLLFPQRPGQTPCEFYVRTGFCKFGQACKFDHPLRLAVRLNSLGLPVRPQETTCPFYAKTGLCKFGPSCKFHHPDGGSRGHAL